MLIDTPGLHKPRTLLGERLNDVVRATWTEVDVIGVCLPANEKIGPGDRYLVGEAAKVRRTPKVAVATKSDLVAPDRMAEHLTEVAALGDRLGIEWAERRAGVGDRRRSSSTCWPTSWSSSCPRACRCIPTARSPTSRRRRWSPS